MKVLVLLFCVILVHFYPGFAQDEEFIIKDQASISKIHPVLNAWQASDNPSEFAQNNGFLLKEGKIQVYIHLTSADSLLQIPSEINVVANDGKIAVAFVGPEQLDEFEKMEFVEKVTPPDLARTPPLPKIETISKQQIETGEDPTGMIIAIIFIIAVSIFTAVFLQRKTKKHLA